MQILLWSLIAIALLAALTFFVLRTRRQSGAGEGTAQPGTPSPSPPSPLETATLPVDKNVQFTVYRPATIVPEKWYPLLAFAHLSERRAGATDQEPDPIQEVEKQAARILSDQPAKYEPAKLDRAFSVPRKGALTFVPLIEGCEFNPPTQSILWQKDVHKVEFEMKASNAMDGRAVEGQMTIYLGSLILAEVALRIKVDSQYSAASEQAVAERADPYRKIFASYSHRDVEIVEDFEEMIQSLGDQYLRDVKTLRSGEVWSEQLEQMIRDANIFQLFWSSNSMLSAFVKQEWEYALSLNRSNFIRPVYWEKQFPEKKPDLPPETLRRLHFYRLPTEEEERSASIAPVPGDSGSSRGRVNIEPVPQPSPAPVQLTRRIPIKALTTVALCVLVAAVLLPLAKLKQSGNGMNTNNANIHYPSPQPTLAAIALDVSVDPIEVISTGKQSPAQPPPSYALILKNLDRGPITDVVILERLPPDLTFLSSKPLPSRVVNDRQVVEWRASQIKQGEEIRIRIYVRSRPGNLKPGGELETEQTITFRDARGVSQTIHSKKTVLRWLIDK